MKKESIIAISFGILLGCVVAFFVISKNKESQINNAKTLSPKVTSTPAPQSLDSLLTLEITSPSDKAAIVDATSVKIVGKAGKNSLIIVQSPIKELAISNDKENFSLDFPVSPGENVIKLVAYPKDLKSRPQEKLLRVYVLSEQ